MGARRFSQFSQRIRRLAIENARRKSRGQRITNFVDGRFNNTLATAFKTLLFESGDIRRAVERGSSTKFLKLTSTGGRFGQKTLVRQRVIEARKKRTEQKRSITKIESTPKRIIVRRRKVFVDTIISQPSKKLMNKRLKEITRVKPITKNIFIKKRFIKIIKKSPDFLSGGFFTTGKLNKEQNLLNKRIVEFNKEFGNKELTIKEFNKAKKQKQDIIIKEKILDKKIKIFERSSTAKFSDLINPRADKTGRDKRFRMKIKPSEIKRIKKEIKDTKEKINKTNSKFNKSRLKAILVSAQSELKRVKEDRPLIPLEPTIELGLKNPLTISKVVFTGLQREKGGKIITDLIFRTNKGRVGIIKGNSITKGKEIESIIGGRSAKQIFINDGLKTTKIKSIVGRSLSKESDNIIKLINKIKKGPISEINKLIKTKKVLSKGKIATVRGKKFTQTIINNKLNFDKVLRKNLISKGDFIAFSNTLSNNNVIKIAGKSLDTKNDINKFKGIIGIIRGGTKKGLSSSSGNLKLSTVQKQKFEKAFKQVAELASASIKIAEKQKGVITKNNVLVLASAIAKESLLKTKPGRRPTIASLKKAVNKIKTVGLSVSVNIIPKTKMRVLTKARKKSKLRSNQLQLNKTKQNSKQKSKQIIKQISNTSQRNNSSTKQKFRTIQQRRNKIRQSIIRNNTILLRRRKTISRIIIPLKFKSRKNKINSIRMTKTKQGYNVFAKPVKGKKLVKVNKVPLTKARAKDLRNYIVDTSLSRTGRIKKTVKKPKSKGRIKVPSGYAKRTTKKFRRFRIIKGKRKLLPKGKVIERRRRLLDTLQEKKGITLRKRLKQLRKFKRKVVKKKKTIIKKKIRRKR